MYLQKEMITLKDTIANRIKEGLKLRGMTQAELSKITNIGKSSISQYISGDYEPKQQNIFLIAKALNVNESWLMGNDVNMDREIQIISLSLNEQNLIKKYNKLDEKGKHTINTILDMEYARCLEEEKGYLKPIAAHGSMKENNIIDPRDLELAQNKKQLKR